MIDFEDHAEPRRSLEKTMLGCRGIGTTVNPLREQEGADVQ